MKRDIMNNAAHKSIEYLEEIRLIELYNLNILDTETEARFDIYTSLISDIFDMPIAMISLIDVDRAWAKSCVGLSLKEIPRKLSLCGHAIYEREIMVIPNANRDYRFEKNPFVLHNPKIYFYAGAVLRGPTGESIGVLCIMDRKPREFKSNKQQQLINFARLVERELSSSYKLEEMRVNTENASHNDFLTGLPNRRILKARLEQTVEVAQYPQQIAVISLKINQLKEIETSAGAEAANFIINETKNRLKKILMKADGISLWEEDHFILFITINPLTSSLLIKLENILEVLKVTFKFNKEKYSISTHLGISIFPDDSQDANHLVENAIYAMRLLSPESSLAYCFFSEESTTRLTKQFELERLLIKAIEANALELYYQPKIATNSGLICGVEALCRWRDPTQGFIPPKDFIFVAEQSHLIIQLGEWVLKTACKQNKEWQNKGLKPIPVSVNISKKQLMNKDFPKYIKGVLKSTKLESAYLDLEITETSLINIDEVVENLNILKKTGVTFSLDDFGTGFSSLSYLQKLPLHSLKIDISFITNLVSNKRDAAMVKAIIAMAKSLDLICVAEGVEKPQQLLFLQAYNCDQIQGYLFSQPLSAEDFSKLLANEQTYD